MVKLPLVILKRLIPAAPIPTLLLLSNVMPSPKTVPLGVQRANLFMVPEPDKVEVGAVIVMVEPNVLTVFPLAPAIVTEPPELLNVTAFDTADKVCSSLVLLQSPVFVIV